MMFVMIAYVVASCDRIKLLFDSASPVQDDHFGALLAAGKPEADLTNFRTLPEPTRSPLQKWPIWYLWEHFLVPEHQIAIWLD